MRDIHVFVLLFSGAVTLSRFRYIHERRCGNGGSYKSLRLTCYQIIRYVLYTALGLSPAAVPSTTYMSVLVHSAKILIGNYV
ncbi:hypothetical protein EDC04DRAFT_2642251, partial [Pisolithus marmoratus]